jgi:hypothetical protein
MSDHEPVNALLHTAPEGAFGWLPVLIVLGTILWFGPDCGRKWLAFARDFRAFRQELPSPRPHINGSDRTIPPPGLEPGHRPGLALDATQPER